MDESLVKAIVILAFISLLIVIIIALLALIIVRRLMQYTTPSVTNLQTKFEALQRANPNTSKEILIRQIINGQAFRCGLVGAITSFGGFITLPIMLPLDAFLSIQLQAALVQFIATVYGHAEADAVETKLRSYLVISGGIRATETSFKLIMDFVVRLLERFAAKIIPLVGALIGFGVNYTIAQGTGRAAMAWYSGQHPYSPKNKLGR
jgi:TRAP-type C4-dicarboxylate transport system permease small subunit